MLTLQAWTLLSRVRGVFNTFWKVLLRTLVQKEGVPVKSSRQRVCSNREHQGQEVVRYPWVPEAPCDSDLIGTAIMAVEVGS